MKNKRDQCQTGVYFMQKDKAERRLRVRHTEHTAWIIASAKANLVTNQWRFPGE